MVKKHFFLASVMLVYRRDALERSKALNVLMVSDTKTVTSVQLGRVQQQAQVRYYTEVDTERKTEVVDVYFNSVSHLGEMTEPEFYGPTYVDPNAPAAEPEISIAEAGEHTEVLNALDEANSGETADE